ncbi:MAG TPA: hypothetical protein VMD59_15960 [Acidimicrobiales bacterium]|nr:hypothetical protein [Acidimicrobiales bacterium]
MTLGLSELERQAPAEAASSGEPARQRPCPCTVAASLVAVAALSALFLVAAKAAYGGNSDDATLVLQGQSMASGHLTLSGWDLSYDAFWTSDVPFYALAVAIVGARQVDMYLVPAVVGALLALVAASMAGGIPLRMRRPAGPPPGAGVPRPLVATLAALGTAVALLALPSPVLSYFLLQGGWHAVTALWCLIAFAGVARAKSRAGLGVAVVFLAAGLLGDLLTAVLGIAPLLVAGAVAARRQASWRAARRYVAAVAGGCALALLARGIALTVGTYTIGSRSVLAAPSQVLRNVASIPDRIAGMLGVTDTVPGVSASPWPFRLAHLVLLVAVVAALLAALADLVRGLLGRPVPAGAPGSAPADQAPPAAAAGPAGATPGNGAGAGIGTVARDESWRLDDLLAVAVLADLVAYVVFATDSNIALARYLVPGVVFAALLAARWIARLVRRHPLVRSRWVAGFALLLVALCGLDFGLDSLGPAAPQEARALAGFLAARHLDVGIGDYWSSSVVSVDSGGRVLVRPVQLGRHRKLVRYDKQSTAAWYHTTFQFFVSDTANPWQGVSSAAAQRTFGAPASVYRVGTYRVLVWAHPVRLLAP